MTKKMPLQVKIEPKNDDIASKRLPLSCSTSGRKRATNVDGSRARKEGRTSVMSTMTLSDEDLVLAYTNTSRSHSKAARDGNPYATVVSQKRRNWATARPQGITASQSDPSNDESFTAVGKSCQFRQFGQLSAGQLEAGQLVSVLKTRASIRFWAVVQPDGVELSLKTLLVMPLTQVRNGNKLEYLLLPSGPEFVPRLAPGEPPAPQAEVDGPCSQQNR